MLITHDGFLQEMSRLPEDVPRRVVGGPALEVALHDLTIRTIDAESAFGPLPNVQLQADPPARQELAAFLAPFDSTICRMITEAELHGRPNSPFEGLGVAPVDSLDLALGLREGDLRIRLREAARLYADDTWFELHFVRAGPEVPWALLQAREAERVPHGRSAFQARVRGVESRVRALFIATMSMEEWWELRERRRASGGAISTLRVGS